MKACRGWQLAGLARVPAEEDYCAARRLRLATANLWLSTRAAETTLVDDAHSQADYAADDCTVDPAIQTERRQHKLNIHRRVYSTSTKQTAAS